MPTGKRPLKVVFAHQYFPGQFAHLARHLVAGGHDVVALSRGLSDGRASDPIAGVKITHYGQELPPPDEDAIGGVTQFIREAASLSTRAQELRQAGYRPDIIYSHTGWGSAAFLHDVFPKSKHIKYCEWYYNNTVRSTEYLHSGGRPLGQRMATTLLNLPILADLARGDALVAPTEWQRSQFPPVIRDKIELVPDGIDLARLAPDPQASYRLPNGRQMDRRNRVVTYVARGADPFRGFEPFLKAVGMVQEKDPAIEAIILGDRLVYYGAGEGTDSYFNTVIEHTAFDPARTHFLGRVPYDDYRAILNISTAHVYLTVPFVLSWSLLEAMAAGCAIVGSDTAPVREFIQHGHNGLLANFFSPEEIAEQIQVLLSETDAVQALRRKARQTIEERWSLDIAIERHLALVDRLLD